MRWCRFPYCPLAIDMHCWSSFANGMAWKAYPKALSGRHAVGPSVDAPLPVGMLKITVSCGFRDGLPNYPAQIGAPL